MREINEIICHCSATGTHQDFDVSDIDRWHRERGFSQIGYHFFIKLNGELQGGRDVAIQGAHCRGRNRDTIGVCFEGGFIDKALKTPWKKPTDNQLVTWKRLQTYLKEYLSSVTKVSGHYQYSKKTCPNFNIDILK